MATNINGEKMDSLENPYKRPRLSYNGYSPEVKQPYHLPAGISHGARDRTSENEATATYQTWLWTFSRNILGGIMEQSKHALEGLKSMGSYILGYPINDNDEDEEFLEMAPGQKRKRNSGGRIPTRSELSSFEYASRVNDRQNMEIDTNNIFQTPWTNATQKEALQRLSSNSRQSLHRPRFYNGQQPSSNTSITMKQSQNGNYAGGADSILETSFNEELEPSGEAVLSASPERIAAAELELSHSPLKSLLEKSPISRLEEFARPDLLLFAMNHTDGYQFSPEELHGADNAGKNINFDTMEDSETFLGHIETERGVRDSHDGQVLDAVTPMESHGEFPEQHEEEADSSDEEEENENDDDECDDAAEEEEEDDDDDDDDDDDEEEDYDDENMIELSSSEEEDDESERLYGLVGELSQDSLEQQPLNRVYANSNGNEVNENANLEDFVSSSSADVIPDSQPIENPANISIDFFTIDGNNDDEAISFERLEGESAAAADKNPSFDPDFEDDPEVVMADEEDSQEYGDDEEEGGEEEEVEAAQDDSDIICDGMIIRSQNTDSDEDDMADVEGLAAENYEEDDEDLSGESVSGSESDSHADSDVENNMHEDAAQGLP